MDSQEKQRAIEAVIDGPKYNNVDPAERKSAVIRSLTKYALRKGMDLDADFIEGQAILFDEDVSNYDGDRLSFKEVGLAMDWGAHGEYGEFTGINAQRFITFVCKYAESEERRTVYLRFRRRNAQYASQVSLYENYIRNWDACCDNTITAWNDYRDGKLQDYRSDKKPLSLMYCHMLAGAYRWLKSLGLIVDDDNTREAEKSSVAEARRIVKENTWKTFPLAGAILFEKTLHSAVGSGFDLGGRILAIKEATTDEMKYALKWKPVNYLSNVA